MTFDMTGGDYLSSDLFAIAEEVGIPLSPGVDEPLENDQYEAFCEKYNAWARQRDALLKSHLTQFDHAFRTLIPLAPRGLAIASQVQWYFDEILIRDPVGRLLEQKPAEAQLEERKIQLRQIIQGLTRFRLALEEGYLLLYGKDARDDPPETDRVVLDELAERPEIARALTDAISWGLESRTAEDGQEWHFYRADLDTAHSLGIHATEVEGQATSPAIQITEKLRQATREEVEQVVGSQHLQGNVKNLLPLEIDGTLKKMGMARSLSATPLFDRQVDGLIIQAASTASEGEFTQIGALNLTLPYIEGASPDALVELRKNEPDAFAEFRLRMNDLVKRAQSGELSEPLEQAAEREILPQLRGLEGEFRALSRTRKFASVLAVTAIVGGGLGAVLLGPAATSAFALGVPAVAKLLGSFDEEGRLVSQPFYWLWKARQ